ncbi:putative uncharacterized protein DDB_G0289263 isoform X4 [Maniola jurtina]|uniref:putative uncharacterized protein DDB_G0289263 isoform X4 n=1 Tax=Maniola jurtina TaxID=191418 RepID=UPI001E687B83|nr:putative uncharacterized protein DDB_G0289263 isoform X4 [Maniola jurtina]
MAPGNKERHPGHTGTIPKTKVRNNCNVPQEAVTPTRRDMASNLVTTSLDWVPVSEYNARSNCNQSRKQTNNTSDQELTDLDNSVAYESGFGRFVPVRPQPRALPLTVQNRENLSADHHDDAASTSSHTLHPYAHQMQNGLIPHSNHAAAAVMIVNPTTPNAVAGNMSQQFNGPNQNRNNLTRNLNSTRNTFDGNNSNNNNNTTSNSRSGTKSVNIMNNMYEQGQGSFNNINENNQSHRESARALGEAIVAACPDAAAVERRLGQIREYIRVTSSLVDTMRNSEDEAFINHTKEEYDELIKMVMQLKESETKLESIFVQMQSSNAEALKESVTPSSDQGIVSITELASKNTPDIADALQDKSCNIKSNNDNSMTKANLKKVTNIENEHLNKTITNTIAGDENQTQNETVNDSEDTLDGSDSARVEIKEIESITCAEPEVKKDDKELNDMLRKNIMACVEKIAIMEEMRNKNKDSISTNDKQDVVVRPVSAQSNGSAYSENELWQNEIKNKMELSQIRLTALKQQQKRLLKYQAEAKQQLEELNKERQSQEIHHPSTSHENFNGMQNLPLGANYQHPNRMYGANQIGVATTLPQSNEALSVQQLTSSTDDHARSTHSGHSQDERFSLRDGNIASSEEAGGGGRDSEAEDDEGLMHERGRMLQAKLRELQLKKQHMENLVSEFQKLQMATRLGSSHNTYSSSGEDSGDDESSRKCTKSGVNLKNDDPFKLMEIKAIKTALQKTKDLMRSVETFEAEDLSGVHEDSFHLPGHSNIHDNKSEGGGSMGGWSNEGSVCRVRNTLPQRHKFTNEQHSQQQVQQQQLQAQQHQQHLQAQQHQQHMQAQQHQQHQQHMQTQNQQQSHEANINTLQQLAQELRMETEKIMGERARISDLVTNKERKQKKVNEDVRSRAAGCPGPAERRQIQLRALLADKQRELEALLNKETLSTPSEVQKIKTDSRTASVVNQSYNSEQEEPESRSEHVPMDSQNSRDTENFMGGGDSVLGTRSINTVPSHLGSAYGSDSDRNKSNQRNRPRRRPTQDRQSEENNNITVTNNNVNIRHEPRAESSNVNLVPPVAQNNDAAGNVPYSHLPPTCWNTNKSNQDTRTNQFTQNSHSQTMDRLLGTPQVAFPPTLPYNMMMPYGMVGGCGCGCGLWGAWCWQQLVMQQRDIHALRDQLTHLEERWRAETASHTLNNQVPPGNRANNYWDNFRSYSRQNLLSAASKSNAEGAPPAAPLAARSHNSLHRAPSSPSLAPKRNTDAPPEPRRARRNLAPDVLNVNQNPNLAPAAREAHDKATSKLFDLLRENIYSEVTTLIGVNEAHPDFLIQLFRELQLVSSEPLRQRVLRSIRGALRADAEPAPTATAAPDDRVVRFLLARAGDACDAELLEALAALILGGGADARRTKRLVDSLAKYEGMRVCDVSSDIIENLPQLSSGSTEDEESAHLTSEISESSILQDVAGSLNLFSSSEPRLHQMNACPYELWPGHVHVDVDGAELNHGSPRSSREGKVDLVDCSEMHNGDLAEADQTCRTEGEAGAAPAEAPGGADALPDVVDTEEVTPTEAEAEWLGLDRVPTRLHMEEASEKQKGEN